MLKKTIIRYEEQASPELEAVDLPLLLKRVYAHRGIFSKDQLEVNLNRLLPFQRLKGIQEAATILAEAIQQQKRLLIVGDYDVDGATSTALMILGLKAMGAGTVDYLIPDRLLYGYGLSPEMAMQVLEKKPELVITVDNGISSIEGVALLAQHGVPVLITDHHLPKDVLPKAVAIVNPNQAQDEFPSKSLAGVGVAFYVLLALRATLREKSWFQKQGLTEPRLANFLDLVALGTVADMVDLDLNNRILVYQGLKRIQAGQCRPGIQAMAQLARRQLDSLTTGDLGYVLSPRLNAAGRLENMALSVNCLLTEDFEEAQVLARELEGLNQERKTLESTMQGEAHDLLNKIKLTEQPVSWGLCVFHESWHQGIVGILASRLKERFNRPVIVFANQNEQELKGSARSVFGLPICDLLRDIAQQYQHFNLEFGGHAMAAGLTLHRKYYEDFSRIFNAEVARKLEGKQKDNIIMSDGELSGRELSVDLAQLLSQNNPWGQGFSEPIFDGTFRVLDQKLFQKRHLKLTVKLDDQVCEAMTFNVDPLLWPNERCTFVRMAYRLQVSDYFGKRKVRLLVDYLEAV